MTDPLRLLLACFLLSLLPMTPAALASDATADRSPRIALIGDSTVADYNTERTTMRGWGQLLPSQRQGAGGEVINRAAGGRSSKSFAREGRWQQVLSLEPRPDYVLIQFGHNDVTGKGPERETLPGAIPADLPTEGPGSNPDDWYRHNLHRYVREARAAGITPVIVSPMERAVFSADGRLRRTNQPWAEAAAAVATEAGTLFIDLNTLSAELLPTLDEAGIASLQFHTTEGRMDRTHFSETGARLYAEVVGKALLEGFPDLAATLAPSVRDLPTLTDLRSRHLRAVTSAAPAARLRLVTLGGSSVADYDPAKTEMRGWGQLLRTFVDPEKADVINRAIGGRSSKSFLREGRWQQILELDPAPAYVLVSFGPNDVTGKGPTRETIPGPVPDVLPTEGPGSNEDDWFRNNLRRYIREARGIGAVPVLVSPQERSVFNDQGQVRRTNQRWVEATQAVAEEMGVVYVDMNRFSVTLLNTIGLERSEAMQFIRADGSVDRSHHNTTGSRLLAECVATELWRQFPALRPVMIEPTGEYHRQFLAGENATPLTPARADDIGHAEEDTF